MFGNFEQELQGVEEQTDRLGGGGFILPSGVYDTTIKLAYVANSASSQAQSIVLVLETTDGREFTETHWFKSGKGLVTYERNGKKHMLPGYEMMNDVCLCSIGEPLTKQNPEEKTIKVYDFEAQKEVEKAMPVLTAILGKPVTVAIQEVRENKQKKDASGDYVDTNEERRRNQASKFFHTASRKTVHEATKGVDLPVDELFISRWAEKNSGQVYDKFKPVEGGPAAAGAAPQSGGGGNAGSLFGN